MTTQTIALLSGGTSSEREVSLSSGSEVYKALDKEKYDVIRYDPATDLPRLMQDSDKIDAALIILHGPSGEDGTVQGLLELVGIPYQGSGVLGSAVAMNKLASKQMFSQNNIPSPGFIVINKHDSIKKDDYIKELGLPVVVKPASGGSSIGMSIVKNEEDFHPALKMAFEQDDTVILEEYIDGLELTCGVLGNSKVTPLPVVEIIPSKEHEFFDYKAKYEPGITEEICPARIDDALTRRVQELAVASHRSLFCKGYSRTDMIMRDNELYVLETNTIPGMTPNSLLPRAAKAFGLSFSELLDKLIELAIEEHTNSKQ